MNMENIKMNEPHKFVLKLSQKLDLRSSNKHVVLQSLFFSFLLHIENVRRQHKNNRLKIIIPIWKDEFELPDGSFSDIQDCIEYIREKHETVTTIPPIHVFINKISNKLMFKIKDGYKLEWQMPQVMKLFRYTKKIKRQNLEIEQSPEVIKVALVQCNLVDNQYQQKI